MGLDSEAHYLDITGEIEVFEAVRRYDDRAREQGIMLLPGVGFDVVPSDCLAAHLAKQVPDADSLALGFASEGGFPLGTMSTAVDGLGGSGMARQNGRYRSVLVAHKTRDIDFGDGPVTAVTYSWGDVSTTYHTNSVPNIEFYLALPRSTRTHRYSATVGVNR